MKLGLAQIDMAWIDVEKNKEKCEEFFKKAEKENVEFLLFPEMTMTGFAVDHKKIGNESENIRSFFAQMTKKYHIMAGFGYAKTEKHHKLKNRFEMMKEGKTVFDYAKMHLFPLGVECENFEPGQKIDVCHIDEKLTASGFICYDLRFPEIFRAVSKESQIIFVIASWPDSRIDQWDILLQARAIENQCYIAAVNRVGTADGLFYTGHSAVYDPKGQKITIETEEEALITAEINADTVKKFRMKLPCIESRRDDLYASFYK